MKKYVTRIALVLLVATSVKSYIFLNNESAHLESLVDKTLILETEKEIREERSIFSDVKILHRIGKKIGSLLPAS